MANMVSWEVDGFDRSSMADAQQLNVLPSANLREFPQPLDRPGGAVLSGAGSKRGSGCPEYPNRTKSATGSPHYEEVLMRAETFCGGHSVRFCPLTITDMRKSAIQPC